MSTVPVEEGKKGKGRPAYKGNPTATLSVRDMYVYSSMWPMCRD